MSAEASTEETLPRLANVGLILVRPRYPENIGAAARIAYNFGIPQLTVVQAREYEEERMLKMATHNASHLIRSMRLVETTAEAAGPYHFIVATTARKGRQRVRMHSPRRVMAEILPLAQNPDNSIGLMFGPENTGLTNGDLDLCQYYSTIPTADFTSLNLAQAVAIHCYELYMALLESDHPHEPNTARVDHANSFDLEGMYDHIGEALAEVTFLDDNNRTYWMRSIRQFLGRVHLTKKEASLIRGICRKFLWHARNRGTEDRKQKTKIG